VAVATGTFTAVSYFRRVPTVILALAAALTLTTGCGGISTTVSGAGRAEPPISSGRGPVRDGALEFDVLDISRSKVVGDPQQPGLSVAAKGVFLIATMSIRNVGDDPVTFVDRDQALITDSGATFVPDMAADIYGNRAIRSTKLSPGDQLVVHIAFDVPPATVPDHLLLRQSASSPGVTAPLP
jgi:hypothetical protein